MTRKMDTRWTRRRLGGGPPILWPIENILYYCVSVPRGLGVLGWSMVLEVVGCVVLHRFVIKSIMGDRRRAQGGQQSPGVFYKYKQRVNLSGCVYCGHPCSGQSFDFIHSQGAPCQGLIKHTTCSTFCQNIIIFMPTTEDRYMTWTRWWFHPGLVDSIWTHGDGGVATRDGE